MRTILRWGAAFCLMGASMAGVRANAAVSLNGAGSTFAAPFYKIWFAGFAKATGITVNYQAVGSGNGINDLKNKTVDFGASDAPLSDSDEKTMPFPVVHVPTAGGAVVISYNLKGVGCGLRFTPEIIADIYLGKIKFWDDPKILAVNFVKSLPHIPIVPVHRSDGSGTTYIFTSFLAKAVPAWASSVGAAKSVSWPVGQGGPGNPGVETKIQQTNGGFGYIELAYAIQNHLPYGSVENAAGNFVMPGVTTTRLAIAQYLPQLQKDVRIPTVYAPGMNSYPISGLTFILIYQHGGTNPGPVTQLWSWAMQKAQQDELKTLDYVPLPKSLITINLSTLSSVQGAKMASGG